MPVAGKYDALFETPDYSGSGAMPVAGPIHPGEILNEEFLSPCGLPSIDWRRRLEWTHVVFTRSCMASGASRRKPRSCFLGSLGTQRNFGWGCKASTTWKQNTIALAIGSTTWQSTLSA